MKNLIGKKIVSWFSNNQKNFKIWSILSIFITGLGIAVSIFSSYESKEQLSINGMNDISKELSSDSKLKENVVRTCDGVEIIEDCELDGKQYTLYKYHPPIEEKYHIETIKKYKTEIVGYCTLCKDGTYSPSCATNGGACSRHGGVAQWNAPIYNQVEYYETVKIIDVPATDERYEVIEKN
jgi:hypothetical protein